MSTKFVLVIDTGNAAFQDQSHDAREMDHIMARGVEVARILADLSSEEGFVNNGYLSGPLRDSNGNKVGQWSYEEK